jgi:hypothetical protein
LQCPQTNLVFQISREGTMGWRFAGLEVGVTSVNLPKDYPICPKHLYYQTNRDKVSEWNCGI